ncbi:TrkH family potassium uptake protein [Haloterrigena sp. SYSU A121-1]|uniref:TrkH family potassium uptake protein n=1 Tax=Haloterrigena gelatinilytica TaxID=2741724 RepID=A0A8J8GSW5_9EURY|nr:TrkH family potassium uptake protein [Haloterrigena gelatinilytica]NUB92855.1 TrkH family potassium uptake protein [Haloterrigena gelatinilytica]
MDETLRRALYDFGTLVKVYAFLPALSIVVAVGWREFYAIPAFLLTAVVAAGLGRGLEAVFDAPDEVDGMSAGVITVSVGWFVAGLLSALPLLLVAWTVRLQPPMLAAPEMTVSLATFLAPVDAVFEGMSGVTGTGFSMASDPGQLPRSLQWWRSLIQWVGGIGVVVLAAAFVSSEESDSFSAVHGNMAPTESIRSTTAGTAAALWWLLALLTVASACWLWLVGMTPWAALNHAMTGVTTGGFTTTASSIESYGDPVLEATLLPVMTVGAVSFSLLFFLFRGDLDRIWGDAQTTWLFGALAVGTALTVGVLLATASYPTAAASVRYGTFQLVSGLTCTGFQTDTGLGDSWAAPGLLAVTLSMIVGGAAGSTAGGVKIVRVRRLLLDAPEHGMDVYDPSESTADTAGGASAAFDTAAIIAVLWFGLLFVTSLVALLVLPNGYATANVLFEVASVQSNVGLSAGIVDATIPASLKVTLVFAMWIGRLEIVPVLVTGQLLYEEVS